ncbi:thiamine diphosphokinase [Ferviditalea candida]|uniref:Thiamine diphosphokinase n=1 Tax=Ferviditalea candida TaxID=3108399 RepID=A0ABU5ZHB7_9BACL|nr:thiamine diphosphokinase [Paenibacillaceae bacterium T2]
MTKRVLIFSGGRLGKWALDEIKQGDILIGADRGAFFLAENGLQPDFSLGDFDSVAEYELEIIRQSSKTFLSFDPVMKDWTDTELAMNHAVQMCPSEIKLLGAIGTRFDHSLANLHLLYKCYQRAIPCTIVDETNDIRLIDHETEIDKGRYTHVSLLPFTHQVTGITLEGFRYPLHKATLTSGDSLGISNVVIGEKARISIETGLLLVIRSMD